MNLFKKWFFKPKRKIYTTIKPVGAPTVDPQTGLLIESQPNEYAVAAFVTQVASEIITPSVEDTAHNICEKMSQAATDHEFNRIIVHPIQGELRREVLEILKNDAPSIGIDGHEKTSMYPMYEYLPANIVNDHDLDSKTIIFKYANIHQGIKPI
jgi:hypothetical protein